MAKKILILGATGAMGVYTVPELLKRGYQVDAVALDEMPFRHPNLCSLQANAKDMAYLTELLKNHYDGIIDYMLYPGTEFDERYELFLENTEHYIYLSTYRIYAGSFPIAEESPRLLDVSTDQTFLKTDDYSLYKARGEDTLRRSKYRNWSAVRPSIVYSQRRFQLCTMEAQVVVERARTHRPILMPAEARNVQATMTWAGDVGRMFAGILFNPRAMGETYTFATSEHHTWGEVAEYYHELIGLETVWVPRADYLRVWRGSDEIEGTAAAYQLDYDRLFDRVIDNRKILDHAGMKAEDMMPLRKGLELELSRLPEQVQWPMRDGGVNQRMDDYLQKQ